MTKAKMPVIMRRCDVARQAARKRLWATHRNGDDSIIMQLCGGITA